MLIIHKQPSQQVERQIAAAIRNVITTAAASATCIKCGNDALSDYPMCAACAHAAHFEYRACLCDPCQSERAADIRLLDGDAAKLADLEDDREALKRAA